MKRTYYLGLDLGTTLGVAQLFSDGSLAAHSIKLKATISDRCTGLAGVLERHATADCLGVCIEEPFSGQFSSVKALFPMMGAAVLKCEELKLPYVLINLATLKKHATGNAEAPISARAPHSGLTGKRSRICISYGWSRRCRRKPLQEAAR